MPPKKRAAAAEADGEKTVAVQVEPPAYETAPPDEYVPLDHLIPYARNARTHSDDQVKEIAAAMVEFGVTNSGLRDTQSIIAGHGRIMAAEVLLKAGVQLYHAPGKAKGGAPIPLGTYPMKRCDGWSEGQRKAYILTDNQLALNAGWDKDLLALEFADLAALDFSFDLMGFDKAFVDDVMGKRVHFGDPDEPAPEPPAQPVTRAGDIWVMGDHRIICGDATDAETVKAMLAGDTPNLMVTDPPYGVEYDPSWRETATNSDGSRLSIGKHATGKVENDGRADWRQAWELFDGDVAYIWHAGVAAGVVAESLIASGFVLRSQLIWDKPVHVIGRGDYHWKHEPCWYAVRRGGKGNWQGDRKQTTVWDIPNMHRTQGSTDDMRTNHGTQKPVECMKRPIENNSKPGDLVYDPFSGSGTTLIACEMTGRAARLVELMPGYVDVAVTRWEAFTKQAAVLEGDGRTFAEVMAERLPPGSVTVTPAEPAKPRRTKPPAKAKETGAPSA